jgi:hypothetical protein
MNRLLIATVAPLMLLACSPSAPAKGEAARAAPATATPTAAQAVDPDAWLRSVYAKYQNQDFSPFTKPADYFDPALIALMDENDRLTPEGEVGAVDGDPICSCQDASGLEARVVSVDRTSRTTAVGKVDLWAGTPDQRRLELDLVLLGDKWRIHNLRDQSDTQNPEGFVKYLLDANAEARAQTGR